MVDLKRMNQCEKRVCKLYTMLLLVLYAHICFNTHFPFCVCIYLKHKQRQYAPQRLSRNNSRSDKCCAQILCRTATIETGQIAMDAKSPSDVKTLCGHIYGLFTCLLWYKTSIYIKTTVFLHIVIILTQKVKHIKMCGKLLKSFLRNGYTLVQCHRTLGQA